MNKVGQIFKPNENHTETSEKKYKMIQRSGNIYNGVCILQDMQTGEITTHTEEDLRYRYNKVN